MIVEWTPMRWPSAWTDPATLSLLKGSAIDYVLIDKSAALDRVRTAALQQGLHVEQSDSTSAETVTVKGEPAVDHTYEVAKDARIQIGGKPGKQGVLARIDGLERRAGFLHGRDFAHLGLGRTSREQEAQEACARECPAGGHRA